MMLAWYAEQGVLEVGDRLVAEVFQQVEHPVDHPDLGRFVPEFDPLFRIVYRRDPARVRIARVWRSEHLLRLSPTHRYKEVTS